MSLNVIVKHIVHAQQMVVHVYRVIVAVKELVLVNPDIVIVYLHVDVILNVDVFQYA